MSAREVANREALEKHLEECRKSNEEHAREKERKRIENTKLMGTKCAEFWERKRRNTQMLRDKSSNQLQLMEVVKQTKSIR